MPSIMKIWIDISALTPEIDKLRKIRKYYVSEDIRGQSVSQE